MALLSKVFTLGGLLRNGWFIAAALAFLGTISLVSYRAGFNKAVNACNVEKAISKAEAAEEAARANREIGNIRVQAERSRAENREAFQDVRKQFEDLQALQNELISNNCELTDSQLQSINGAILRSRGAD